jgi:hypothetical protein
MASHPVSYATYSKPFFDALLDFICAEGVPIYNGDQWCEFNDRRNAVQVEQSVEGDTLTCTVRGLVGSLPLMIPISAVYKLRETDLSKGQLERITRGNAVRFLGKQVMARVEP